MTTFESHRSTVEARKVVGSSTWPMTRHEAALQKYLTMTAHLSETGSEALSGADQLTLPTTIPSRGDRSKASGQRSALVVVGVDDSECARCAARWAADEAARRQGSLLVVHASPIPAGGLHTTSMTQHRDGQAIVSDVVAALHDDHPTLSVSAQVCHGSPAAVLRRASANAVLTVVGVQGRNRVALAMGSVAADVAASSPASVAVIRSGDVLADGPVVVGVDGRATSDAAIAYALETALMRGATVAAVHCWTDPVIDGPVAVDPAFLVADPQSFADAHRALLAERLAGWAEKYPQVPVKQVLVHGETATVLGEFAETAQLIVVGTRGHGRLANLLLGSTSQAMIAHSPCPVVIARSIRPTGRPTDD